MGKGKKRRRRRTKKTVTHTIRRRARSVAKRVRRHAGSAKLKLNMSGIKKALDFKAILLVAAGAVGARALYGYMRQTSPTMDPKLAAGIGLAGPVLGGIAMSGKAKVAIPIAVGAVGMAVLDMAARSIAEALQSSSPGAAQGILTGFVDVMNTNTGVVPLPIDTGGSAGVTAGAGLTDYPFDTIPAGRDYYGMGQMPDAYGMGQLPDAYGNEMGDLDLVSL